MPLPLVYNLRSVKERWTSSLVAIIGIAGTVGVFVAMLALARGFQATLVSSGQPRERDRAAGGRRLRDDERDRARRRARVVEDSPQVRPARGPDALVSARSRRHRGAAAPRHAGRRRQRRDARRVANGCSRSATTCTYVRAASSRRACTRSSSGKNAALAYEGLDLGGTVRIGPGTWKVVGIFDAGGSAFDSRDLGRRQRAQRQLPASDQRLPVGDGEAALGGRLRRLPDAAVQHEPAPAGAGVARAASTTPGQSRTVTTLITVLGGTGRPGHGPRRDSRGAQHDVLGGLGALARDRRPARHRLRLGQHRPLVRVRSRC